MCRGRALRDVYELPGTSEMTFTYRCNHCGAEFTGDDVVLTPSERDNWCYGCPGRLEITSPDRETRFRHAMLSFIRDHEELLRKLAEFD